ncbi:CvpA family protein [Floccifex sp.]|uniref:CvpA family protein n=1 Tax=Floccifex sp. TaxID=2815810 RepID=UPI003F077C6F
MTLQIEYFNIYVGILVFICLMNLISGYKKGLICQIFDVISMLICFYVSFHFCDDMASLIPFFHFNIVNQILWFFICYVVLKCIFSIFENLLRKAIYSSPMKKLDRLLGMGISCIKILIMSLFLVLICHLPWIENGQEFIDYSPLKYVEGVLYESK